MVGDAATALPAAWIMLESYHMGLPKGKLMRQGVNVAADAVFGSIPLLGTLFDAGFKSNRRNVDILRKHLETLPGEAPAPDPAPDGRMIERG